MSNYSGSLTGTQTSATSRRTVKQQQKTFHAAGESAAAASATSVHVPNMGSEERLSHIRQGATRIQHALEVHRHAQSVYFEEGEEPTTASKEVSNFFSSLGDELPFLLFSRKQAKNLGFGKSSAAVKAGKKDDSEMPRRSKIVKDALEKAFFLRDRIASEFSEKHPEPEAEEATEAVCYPHVQLQLLDDILLQLKDLHALLPSTDTGTLSPLPSREVSCTQHLLDAVRHFLDDCDAFHEEKLHKYVQECINEASRYSATLPSDSAAGGEPDPSTFNMISMFLADVAVGVFPGRNARIVLDHLSKFITMIYERVKAEQTTVEKLAARANTLGELDNIDSFNQQLTVLQGYVQELRNAENAHRNLAKKWEESEQEFLNKAVSGVEQSSLIQLKKLSQSEIIENAQEVHKKLARACTTFISPQYCRKMRLTYSNPCSIRVGLKLFSAQEKRFLTLTNLNPAVVTAPQRKVHGAGGAATTPLNEIDEYLLPSVDQLWFAFDQFPEVIKGGRCHLRESVSGNPVVSAATKQVHELCLEEQREVGGYFLLRGGERILRALLMQRSNVPLCIDRSNFATSGPQFTSKALVVRSKRPSGSTSHNYFFSTTTGEILYSFARRMVWHIPVGLVLFSLKNISHSAVYNLLTANATTQIGNDKQKEHMIARAEALVQHHINRPYGRLTDYKELLAVLGRMYKQYQQKANAFHFIPDLGPSYAPGSPHQDAWYGLFMLRKHFLPHLNCEAPTPDLLNHAMNGTEEVLTGETHAANLEELAHWPGPAIEKELDGKFHALIDILTQLNGFVSGAVDHQGNDIPSYQEVFASSQILMAAFESCVSKYLKTFVIRMGQSMKNTVFHQIMTNPKAATSMQRLKGYLEHASHRGHDALAPMHRLLVTGNFVIENEDYFYMPQNSGWVCQADHLNFFRFFEQLRVLHRGKRVADMRSSEVRRFPCEAFGFLCMVHSPDGADCGVLNHMTLPTVVTNSMTSKDRKTLFRTLHSFRYILPANASLDDKQDCVPINVEGVIVGYVPTNRAAELTAALRKLKEYNLNEMQHHFPPSSVEAHALRTGMIPRSSLTTLHLMEVINVPPKLVSMVGADRAKVIAGMHPGVYIFTENGRMMRPVKDLKTGQLIYVGTWEHIWMDIAGVPSDLYDARASLARKFSHIEPSGSGLISLTSATIPFFEHNCSPRNLFQCGLSKQSSGTQLQSAPWRKEAKLFRTLVPQKYIVRTLPMDNFGLDEYSLGVNAVVAIIAYSGYDMDDAVIINHSAVERGMLNAMITIAKVVDLTEYNDKASKGGETVGTTVFHNLVSGGQERFSAELQSNGLPYRRSPAPLATFDRDHHLPQLLDNTPVYCTAKRFERRGVDGKMHYEYSRHHVNRWRSFDKGEAGWVHNMVPLTYDGPDVTSALFVFRIPRYPTVGDKFSSRHGQKGTLPLHVRAADLPFSAVTGTSPDVLINPHAFPSRMTVGMVLEIMAGKAGAQQGRFIDHSAWTTVDEDPVAADDIGNQLAALGFQRNGRETLICGMTGEEMASDVFVGISGYQRLRHQVNDKWQSRARTDNFRFRAVSKTGQPVKGRKRHGGVRVGEMERDGLLSHGIAEVVMDRLLHVSDGTRGLICMNCGGLMCIHELHSTHFSSLKQCRYCGTETRETAGSTSGGSSNDTIRTISIPQVLRLWIAELTSVGVRVTMKVA